MKYLRNPHQWIIIVLFTLLSFLPYLGLIRNHGTNLAGIQWGLTHVGLEAFLFLIPVVYEALLFGFAAGLFAVAAVGIVCIPPAFFTFPIQLENVLLWVVLVVVGVLVCYLVWLKNKEVIRADKTVAELNVTHNILQRNLDALTVSEKRLNMLNAISETLNSSLEIGRVFQKAVHLVSELMSSEVTLLYILDEPRQELILVAHEGVSEEFAISMARVKVGEGVYGEVARVGKTIVIESRKSDLQTHDDAFYKMRLKVQMIVPLVYQERISGIVCVASRRPRNFSCEEADLMTAAGRQVAAAIENAHLYDIQRQITQQLTKSEGNYRRLFEMASDAIWASDLSGTITEANHAALELMGFGKGEVIGVNGAKFLSPESLEVKRQVRMYLLSGESFPQPYEQRLIRFDKTEVILMVSTSLVRHNDSPPVFENVARDVTKERRMQDNLRHYVQQITRIQEEERNRIARELHDDTAQALYVLTRQVDNYVRSTPNLPEDTSKFLTSLGEYIRSVLHGVRRFSQDLRPPMLDDLGLLATVRWLVGDMEQRTRVITSLTVKGTPRRLTPHIELAIFRIVQEALRNVEKHASAKEAEVKIEFNEKNICILVKDDGVGFKLVGDVGELPREGRLGLMGMEERARLLGGNITINSELNQGTRLMIDLPV